MTSTAAAHCAVMRNPFSTAVAAAKIPDGMATLSTASRLSHSNKVTSVDGEVSILMYPGFYGGLATRHGVSDGQTPPTITRQTTWAAYGDIASRQSTLTTLSTGSTSDVITHNNALPNNYRVVSQGLRLSLINNSLDNDGYFEAIRIAPSWSISECAMIAPAKLGTATGVAAGDSVKFVYSPTAFEAGMLETSDGFFKDWSMNPTYISGKLRDIHKHTFNLHRIEDNEFQNVQNQSHIISADSDYIVGARGLVRTAGDECFFMDRKMDCILIRCRASASIAAPLSVHFHMVQHVEEMYDQNTDLARFQTIPPVAPKLTQMVINAIKRDIKPSIIRIPTSGVSLIPRARKRRVYRRTYRRYKR